MYFKLKTRENETRRKKMLSSFFIGEKNDRHDYELCSIWVVLVKVKSNESGAPH